MFGLKHTMQDKLMKVSETKQNSLDKKTNNFTNKIRKLNESIIRKKMKKIKKYAKKGFGGIRFNVNKEFIDYYQPKIRYIHYDVYLYENWFEIVWSRELAFKQIDLHHVK